MLGRDVGELSKWFERPAAEWLRLSDVMHARNRYSLPQRFREWTRRLVRFLQPSGLRLTFLGPDGVGKSATIAGVQALLEPCFRRRQMFHFRPMMFQESDGRPVPDPHGRPPRSAPASWFKVLWYFCDHWLGWWCRQRAALSRSTCIVFDRNFDDALVDARRYRLQKSGTLLRLLRPWLPRFDLQFILDAPAKVMHRRKPELPVAELERQRAALRSLAERDPRYLTVSTDAPPDEVARAVCRHVIRFLAAREQRRFGGAE